MGVEKKSGMIKVKALPGFMNYRNKVLGLPKKDFRALQQGKEALIPKDFKYMKVVEEVKDGN